MSRPSSWSPTRAVVLRSASLSRYRSGAECNGAEPPESEIEAYVERLKELKAGGAQIPLVQIYSASRPALNPRCGHLSLGALSRIARRVREATGLTAEVF